MEKEGGRYKLIEGHSNQIEPRIQLNLEAQKWGK